MSKLLRRCAITVVSTATVVSLSGAGALLPIAHGATVAELTAQINELLVLIQSLQTQLAALQGVPAAVACSFTRDLTVGVVGDDVKCLQRYLNGAGYAVAPSGVGSAGLETTYFGSLTQAAVAKWQAGNNVSPAVGYFGPLSRAKYSALAGVAPVTPVSPVSPVTPVTPVVPAGTGLTVSLHPIQPTATLAPFNANRIPFTKFQLTASADGDVVVNSVVVQRVGLAEDEAFAGVMLLDERGLQLGLEKTLSSVHQCTIGEQVTIKAGQTKAFTIAARRAAQASRGGQTGAFALVKVNTSAVVHGLDAKLIGTTHTVNETLSIGSLGSNSRGPLDPGATQTKEIGTETYTFSSVKVTAGSEEDVRLMSIRWNQSGSATASDLENVKVYVDGVAYGTVLSADSKYYTAVFDGGIVIKKGFNKEAAIKGDLVGGAARTVDLDVYKRSDIYILGEVYGYGILPADGTTTSGTDDGNFHNTNPWFDAFEVYINKGTLTVSKDPNVQAQNIAINLADQVLGGWLVEAKGEPVSVGQMIFSVHAYGDQLAHVDNVSVINADTGTVLAGPIDPTSTLACCSITFSDTITWPIGITKIKMQGKLSTDFVDADQIDASTTPSSQWTSVTGDVTGNTITPAPTSAVGGTTMTVKAGALTISVAAVPIAQTIISGINQYEFARYILDATGSGEDLRLTSLPLEYRVMSGTGAATDLTHCKLYDGAVAITTGSNEVNPSAVSSTTSFVFDGTGLTLAKGTSKQLSLKCDLKAGSTGSYSWGYDSSADPDPTGLVSGQSIGETEVDSMGQLQTATDKGVLTVALDSGSPVYKLVSPGQTVELVRLKYSASNESVDVRKVGLQLTDTASNTPINLLNQEVSLWVDGKQVGSATFLDAYRDGQATSSLIALGDFKVPKDGSKVLVVKGTVAGIAKSGPNTKSGDLLKVDYDGDDEGLVTNANYGVGVDSGLVVTQSNSDSASNGVRLMKGYPTMEQIALTTSEKVLVAGDAKPLYKFKITAHNNDIALYKVTFTVSSSTASLSNATVTKFALYAFTDSAMSTPDPNFSGSNNPGGLVNSGTCYSGLNSSTVGGEYSASLGTGSGLVEIYPDKGGTCGAATTSLEIPAGETRWFKLTGSIGTLSPSGTTETLQIELEGDAAFPDKHQTDCAGCSGEMGNTGQSSAGCVAKGIEKDSHNDFIWSPRSTSTAASVNDLDWTNGYGVVGLPSTNMTVETLSK